MPNEFKKVSVNSGFKASLVVASISALAGIVLLAQDIFIAAHFSIGPSADAYHLAVSFPSLAINVFAGGTLLAVLVPLLAQLFGTGRGDESHAVMRDVCQHLAWFLLIICMMWAAIFPLFIHSFAKDFAPETLKLSVYLTWMVIPIVFFSGMSGVNVALLNSKKHFKFISSLPAFLPATVILVVFFFEKQIGIFAAATGMLLGSMLQWGASSWSVKSRNLSGGALKRGVYVTKQLLLDYFTVVISTALLAGIYMTDTFVAASISVGSTSTYSYAVRPVILFQAFATAAIGNVLLPIFSQLVVAENWSMLRKHILSWFSLLIVGSVPLVVIWYFFANELVTLLYQRGLFLQDDSLKVSSIQQIYLLQIPFFLIGMVGSRVMSSLNKHRALLLITLIAFVVNLFVDLALLPTLSLQGVAWGTNAALVFWALLITLYLVRFRNVVSLKKELS
jgi:putative peptidoglycan lipid II flippase